MSKLSRSVALQWCIFMICWVRAQAQAPAGIASDSPSDVPSSAPSVSSLTAPSLLTSLNPAAALNPASSAGPAAVVPVISDAPSALPTVFASVPTLPVPVIPTISQRPDSPSNAPAPQFTTEKPNVAPSIFQAPTIAYCREEADSVRQCYKGLDDAGACDSCAADAIPNSAADCSQLNNNLCEALAKCPCLECTSVVEGFLACAFTVTNGCNIDCT